MKVPGLNDGDGAQTLKVPTVGAHKTPWVVAA